MNGILVTDLVNGYDFMNIDSMLWKKSRSLVVTGPFAITRPEIKYASGGPQFVPLYFKLSQILGVELKLFHCS